MLPVRDKNVNGGAGDLRSSATQKQSVVKCARMDDNSRKIRKRFSRESLVLRLAEIRLYGNISVSAGQTERYGHKQMLRS